MAVAIFSLVLLTSVLALVILTNRHHDATEADLAEIRRQHPWMSE